MTYKHVSTEQGLDAFIEFLEALGIATKLHNPQPDRFCRKIVFSVEGCEYLILWYVNESTLHIGTHERAARIPFQYIFLDNTYPLPNGNRSIAFSYVKHKQESVFDRQFPYEVFRIPLPIQKGGE